MLVICNNENSGYHLTKGKTYLVEYRDGITSEKDFVTMPYMITNDRGYQHFAEKNIFTPLHEFREQQINKILEK